MTSDISSVIFKSEYTPKEFDLGKFVLYRTSDNEVILAAKAGRSIKPYSKEPEQEESFSERFYSNRPQEKRSLAEYAGDHRAILRAKQGKVLGGAAFYIPNPNLFELFGLSGNFGPVNDEVVQRCLGNGIKVKRIDEAHNQYRQGNLEYFLNKEEN